MRCCLLAALLVAFHLSTPAASLERLAFNNPDLHVDLGAGLWATPIPWDADGDGDFDLIVVCHDKPYQGTYLFENLLLNSSNANFLRQMNARDGKWFFRNEGPLHAQNIEGHDVSPAVTDFSGDGVLDFLGGAEDGHFYFMRNPRH